MQTLPNTTSEWTEDDRRIMERNKVRIGDRTLGAAYRLADHRDATVMHARCQPHGWTPADLAR